MIYDVIFIGAGPASLMAAKELLGKGLSVLIVEKGKDINRRKDPICGWFGSGVSRVDRLEFEDSLLKAHEVKDSINYLKKIDKMNYYFFYYLIFNMIILNNNLLFNI